MCGMRRESAMSSISEAAGSFGTYDRLGQPNTSAERIGRGRAWTASGWLRMIYFTDGREGMRLGWGLVRPVGAGGALRCAEIDSGTYRIPGIEEWETIGTGHESRGRL